MSTASHQRHTFGPTVRALRQEKGIGLRELARRVGMSPTYLTQIEKDECPVPEERVVAFARALEQDADEFLALAGRVASDVDEIIRSRPRATANFLRVASRLSDEEWAQLTQQIQEKQS